MCRILSQNPLSVQTRNRRQKLKRTTQIKAAVMKNLSTQQAIYNEKRKSYDKVFRQKVQYHQTLYNMVYMKKKGLNVGPLKSKVTKKVIGGTPDQFLKHLKSTFKPGMNWKNHGRKGWRIETIKPLAEFNLKDPKERKLAFSYFNCKACWVKPPNE